MKYKGKEDYDKDQAASGIEVGDVVMMMRIGQAYNEETGWGVDWMSYMGDWLGKCKTVVEIIYSYDDHSDCYGLDFGDDHCCYPFYIFSIVKKGVDNHG